MTAQTDGLMMDTDNLLQYNPKLADVSHTTRIAYAKFMTTKIKKEIKFQDEQDGEQMKIENELARSRGAKALSKFKLNAGILKKPEASKNSDVILQNGNLTVAEVEKSSPISPPASPENLQNNTPDLQNFPTTIERDFRARSPIEEENEIPSDRSSTPTNSFDNPDSKILSPRVLSPLPSSTSDDSKISPCPSPNSEEKSPRKEDNPLPTPTSSANIPEIKTPEPSEPNVPKVSKNSHDSSTLLSPLPPVSPSISFPGSDKGKSKISGKTLTGWL